MGKGQANASRMIRLVVAVAAMGVAVPSAASGQLGPPFHAGEELNYRVRAGLLGTIGTGRLTVEGPVVVRGADVLLLRSEITSTVSWIRGVERSASWFDPVAMRTLRFEKYERSPFATESESIEVFGPERRWVRDSGESGPSLSDAPLDELSFIYFIRTLSLFPNESHDFDRHFDEERNPVTVRVVRRERVTVGAGEFDAVLVEMHVRDPRRYRGTGTIRIHFSDGPCRLPLRIESSLPLFGKTVLMLESHSHPVDHFPARSD